MGIFNFRKKKEAAPALPETATKPVNWKKYVFEAEQKLLERPTQDKYLFVPPAQVTVYAGDETEAGKKAADKLRAAYYGTGVLLGEAKLVRCDELPVDWSYGYGDERQSGSRISDPVGRSQIR